MQKITKLFFMFGMLSLCFNLSNAQNVGVGTANPDASALLDISTNTKGLLLPRNTTSGIATIPNPAKGLLVLDTILYRLMLNTGTAALPNWQTIVFNSGWNLVGNSGTNAATNFIGTSDNQPVRFKVSNLPAGFIGGPELGSNVFMGIYSGGNNTFGSYNVAYGRDAMSSNTAGAYNSSLGAAALRANTTGDRNTAIGAASLIANSIGYDNTALGYGSLNKSVSYYNTAVGSSSLFNNTTGHDNTASGYAALDGNTTGNFNAAFGAFALAKNLGGTLNTAIGYKALENSTGNFNTAVGKGALSINIVGIGNTAIGQDANNDQANSNYNTIIGSIAHINATSNSVAIGYGAYTNVSNLALLGNISTTQVGGYANWSNFSDGRFKNDVKANVAGLDFIMKLRPVTYFMNVRGLNSFWGINPYGADEKNKTAQTKIDIDEAISKKEAIRMTGFVAQEVEKAAKEVGYDFDGVIPPAHDKDHYRIAYGEFVVPLVKAVQEQQLLIEKQNKIIDDLLKRIIVLEGKKTGNQQ